MLAVELISQVKRGLPATVGDHAPIPAYEVLPNCGIGYKSAPLLPVVP